MVRSRFSQTVFPRATRLFTDREEPIRTFERAIAERDVTRPKVVSFYGVGGVGKSRLCREMLRRLGQREDPRQQFCVIDFAMPVLRDPVETLLLIRRSFRPQPILFDFAVLRWWAQLGRRTEDMKDKLGENSGGLLGHVLDFAGTAGSELMVGAGVVPTYRLLAEFAERAKWGLRRAFGDRRRELERIESLNLPDLAEALPYFLGLDIAQSSAADYTLFFDSYENLWLNRRDELRPSDSTTDQWIRDLLAPANGMIAFFFGRRRLAWADLPGEGWSDAIEEHLLGALANEDADRFLMAAGVEDAAVRTEISTVAQGLPFVLDVCLDIIEDVREKEGRITPAIFGGSHRHVFERVLQNLPIDARETATVLAVPRSFDRALFRHLVRAFRTGFPETGLSTLTGYSFLEVDGTGRARFHDLMRLHILRSMDQELLSEVRNVIVEHYIEAMQTELAERLAALDEVLHLLNTVSAKTEGWLFRTSRDLCNAGYWYELSQILKRQREPRPKLRDRADHVQQLFAAVCERRLGSAKKAAKLFHTLDWSTLPTAELGFARFERADVLRLCGRYDDALVEYLAVAEDQSYDGSDRARAAFQAADVLTLKGLFKTAASRIGSVELRTPLEEVIALRQRGHVMRFQLEVGGAEWCYQRALELAKSEGLRSFEAKLLTNLLEVRALALVGRDLVLENESIALNESVGSPVEVGKCLAARGLAGVLAGDPHGEKADFTEARRHFTKAGYEGGKIILCFYEGIAALANGQAPRAIRLQELLRARCDKANVYDFLVDYLRILNDSSSTLGGPEYVDAAVTHGHLERIAQRLALILGSK